MNPSRILAPVATLLVALALWEAAVRILNPPAYLVPAPSAVARAAYAEGTMLAAATVRTAIGSAGGFAVAGVLGLALGSAIAAVGFLLDSVVMRRIIGESQASVFILTVAFGFIWAALAIYSWSLLRGTKLG